MFVYCVINVPRNVQKLILEQFLVILNELGILELNTIMCTQVNEFTNVTYLHIYIYVYTSK